MNKIKGLAKKIVYLVPFLPSFALAQLAAPAAVTPPAIPQTDQSYTLTKAWTQVGVYLNYAVALIGIISVVMLLYGAYLYMTGGASEDNAKKAKTAVIYAVIGGVIAVLAFSIFSIAKSLIGV